ncbi:MAG TPA: hypothetical protein VKX49_32065 [Bryobacteraceae bacterium]|nr:hypothetical protein [Bryobacteraceae bacterium]
MPLDIVATPLRNGTVTRRYDLGNGIEIRQLAPIRWDVAIVKSEVCEREREDLARITHWLCATRERTSDPLAGHDLFARAHAAAMTLQILCPTGNKHVFLRFQETPTGWDNIESSPPNKPLCKTFIGRSVDLEAQTFPQDFTPVYDGIRRANHDRLVRLINPVHLLEHGLQTCHAYLGTMFFVIGLDVLFMAGESERFIERVAGFLGPTTLLFPRISFIDRQPNTTPQDVVESVYDLRNTVAHGQEIPEHPYRQPYRLMSTEGEQINQIPYSYADFMLDSSLFLLTNALRRVFTQGHYDNVASKKQWRQTLASFEHQYKAHANQTAVAQD